MPHHGTKVLVVEDSRSINGLLSQSISSQLHIDVVSTSSMAEAKEYLKNSANDFFVALLDLNLPDAPDGEIVDCVLGYNIPPIILTGSISDNLHDEMMDKPIIDYVVKRNINEIEYVIDMVRRLRDNQGCKALIVDDSKSSRTMLKSLLERHYFTVLTANDGIEALAVLEQHNDIQLIIADYNMPNMDGIELTAKVRNKYSRNEIAIIGISASGGGTTTVKFLKAGANDFITRPFLHEEFYCRINQNVDAIRSFAQLKNAANKDFLTGLHNRKYLFDAGNKLFENARRNNISLITAMIDIDHFKQINDTHGHQIGDQALQHVSEKLARRLRTSDIIARVGGEEFCLLYVNADAEHCERELLANLCDLVQFSPLQVNDTLSIPLTISIGYSTELTDSLEEMVNNADAALYRAKQAGRNRVARHEPFTAEETMAR